MGIARMQKRTFRTQALAPFLVLSAAGAFVAYVALAFKEQEVKFTMIFSERCALVPRRRREVHI